MTRSWAPQSRHAFRHDFASIAQWGIEFDFLYCRIAKTPCCDCIESLFVFCYNVVLFDCSLRGIIALRTNDNSIQSELAWKQRQRNLIFVYCIGRSSYSFATHSPKYSNPSNLGHQFNLILLIFNRNIKREIKILHQKSEIGKISKNLSKTHILLLNPWRCINNWQKKSGKVRKIQGFCKADLSNYCL